MNRLRNEISSRGWGGINEGARVRKDVTELYFGAGYFRAAVLPDAGCWSGRDLKGRDRVN